jgi:hypothetical protein
MKANASMAWSIFDEIVVTLHNGKPPRDVDWAEYMSDVERTGVRLRGILVIPRGTRITPKQRVEVQKWFEVNKARAALVTDSAVSRGVVTALSWFGVAIKAYRESELEDAMRYLAIPREAHGKLRNLAADLTGLLREQVPVRTANAESGR